MTEQTNTNTNNVKMNVEENTNEQASQTENNVESKRIELTQEQKNALLSKKVDVNLGLLINLRSIVDAVTARGAYRTTELKQVGTVYEELNNLVNENLKL